MKKDKDMEVTVLLDNLVHGLGIVNHAVPGKSTLPICETVLLSTDTGRLRIRGTNLEQSITTWVGAKIEAEGEVAVPAKVLMALVSQLPDSQVSLSLDARVQTLTVKSGGSKASIKCIDAREFPPLVQLEESGLRTGQPIELAVYKIKTMIGQVAFAASTDLGRGPALNGVLVDVGKDVITMAAADGFRLSVSKTALDERFEPASAIVPVKALLTLSKIITDGEQVRVLFLKGDRQIGFVTKDIELITQVIDGKFPDYKQIIPRSHKTRTLVSTSALLSAVRRAEIFAAGLTRFTIKHGESTVIPGHLDVFANSDEIGEATTNLEANVEGYELVIGFNTRYLRDMLEVIETPDLAIETNMTNAPGIFLPVGDDSFLHVIMPMHLADQPAPVTSAEPAQEPAAEVSE